MVKEKISLKSFQETILSVYLQETSLRVPLRQVKCTLVALIVFVVLWCFVLFFFLIVSAILFFFFFLIKEIGLLEDPFH